MANEPNNAEEQLKQYAAERRQQVPPEIHRATRNVLQGEVRRVYGSPQEERRAGLRMRWLQAFAWIAILVAIPLFLLPRQPKDMTPPPAPARPGEVTLPMEKTKGEAPIVLSDTREPVAPIVVAPQPATAPQPAPTPVTTRADKQVRVAPTLARAEPESRARAMDTA